MIEQVIAHYRIIRKLGAGAMGEVYLAQDTALGRPVALKLLPLEYTQDEERLRRFKQEAKAASALNHPNILTIHEVGEAEGRHFIATEFIDGESLREVLTRHPRMSTDEVLRVGSQVASALAVAHEAGIVHRDLKPENVMLRRDGYVKVLDFGLAKLMEPATGQPSDTAAARSRTMNTMSGTVVGTAPYMSPEQATAGTVDARSDIFAFGAVLYEMISGKRAFEGGSLMETVAALLTREPGALPAGTPPVLSSIVDRCLKKDPAGRYQTMAELKVALDDARGTPVHVRHETPLSLWRPVVLVAGAAAIVVAGAFAFRAWRAPGRLEPLTAVPLTTLTGVVRYPSFSPDGDRVVFTWTGTSQDNPDLYVQQVGSGSPLRLTTDPGNDHNPVWSPDGRWIAFLRNQSEAGASELRLIAPLGGTERVLATIHIRGGILVSPPHLAWCPDSECLVVTDSPGNEQADALFVISLETGDKRQLTHPKAPATGDTHPAISPDGRWLVFRRMAGTFIGELYRLALNPGVTAGGDSERLTLAAMDAQHPAWMPDGREILFSAKSSLWRVRVDKDDPPARLPFVGDYGVMPVVSAGPGGRSPRLVYVRMFDDGNIWRIETSSPGARATSPPVSSIASTRQDGMPHFSPDGHRVAFTSDRSGTWEIWVSDPDGSNAVQLTSLGAVASGYPKWSPDGQRIAFHTNVEGQWEVYVISSTGGKPQNLTTHPASDVAPSFSADGNWIWFSSNRSGVQHETLWKIPATGGSALQVTTSAGWAPLESPDGMYLYYVEAVDRPSPLWRMAASGGTPTRVLDGVFLGNFAVGRDGIYFIDRPSGGRGVHYVDVPFGDTRLRYFDFARQTVTTVAQDLGRVDVPLTVSPDGRIILFARVDATVNDLMLVANFK
jgi:Tol biopolymer transport system component